MLNELRKQLIDHGFPEDDVKGLSKKQLMAQIQQIEKEASLLDNLGLSEEPNKEQVISDNGPSYLSQEWNAYVMSQFTENELSDGHPNVNGLRRIVELLLGPIISSRPVELNNKGNPVGTSCLYEIGISWKRNDEGLIDYGEYGIRLFGGAAGSNEDNTDGEFALYPEAISETRAEARALRKALRLHQVSAEEVSKKAKVSAELRGKQVEWCENDLLDPIQAKTITNRCELLGINLEKLVSTRGVESVDKLTKSQAADLIMLLNQFQTQNLEIPTEMKG